MNFGKIIVKIPLKRHSNIGVLRKLIVALFLSFKVEMPQQSAEEKEALLANQVVMIMVMVLLGPICMEKTCLIIVISILSVSSVWSPMTSRSSSPLSSLELCSSPKRSHHHHHYIVSDR